MAKRDLPAVAGRNLPANWEKQMAADAEKAVKQEEGVGVGQFMSIRGGILKFQDTPVPGNRFRGVILAAILENAYYTKDFDPQNPSSPDCYAFGQEEGSMVPHDAAPERQNGSCADCKWNKFGSAEKGRGKACKNGRRMGLIHEDDLKKDPKDWQVAFLKIPPTSLPGWASYVRSLSDMTGRPPYAVITEVAVVNDPKSQYKVTFTLGKKVEDKRALAAMFMKHNELEKSIGFPYQVIEAPANGNGNGGMRKGGKTKKAVRQAPPPPPAKGGGGFGARGGAQAKGGKDKF